MFRYKPIVTHPPLFVLDACLDLAAAATIMTLCPMTPYEDGSTDKQLLRLFSSGHDTIFIKAVTRHKDVSAW